MSFAITIESLNPGQFGDLAAEGVFDPLILVLSGESLHELKAPLGDGLHEGTPPKGVVSAGEGALERLLFVTQLVECVPSHSHTHSW